MNSPRAATVWEARAQVDIAVLIERYLTENPPPPAATHPHLYRAWASDMRLAGEAGLEDLAVPRLRVVAARDSGISGDDAAWAMVAAATGRALTLLGLSRVSFADLLEVWTGARMAAGLPAEQRPQHVEEGEI